MPMFPRRPAPASSELARGSSSLPQVTGAGGVVASWEQSGLVIRDASPKPIWAKITGQASGTNRYAWTQVDEGDTSDFDTGLSEGFAAAGTSDAAGAPAYEINQRTDVPTSTRVQLWPAGDGSFYLFAAPPTTAPLAFVGAHVTNAGAQTVATATPTTLTFDTEDYDTSAFHSTSSNTSRLTIPAGLGGYYRVGAFFALDENATGVRYARLLLNGNEIAGQSQAPTATAAALVPTHLNVNFEYLCVAGDYWEIVAYQTSGITLSTSGTGVHSSRFWISRIGST